MKILITGASGFIGRQLVNTLAKDGHELFLLAHQTGLSQTHTCINRLSDLPQKTSGLDAVINLAGAPIMGKPWTAARKRVLWDSRVLLTETLVETVAQLPSPPRIFLSGSAIGIYGDQGDASLDESAALRGGFGHQLCVAWEQAAQKAEAFGARVVLLRTGLVIGAGGGFLKPMEWPFRLGLGGPIGQGQQWMSWIHRDDHIRLLCALLVNPDARGPINLTAPSPVTNTEFTATLARIVRRPAFFRIPAKLLQWLLGEMAGLLLESTRVIPDAAIKRGFTFKYPDLEPALREALGED
ncbi:MAG: hypothetical protein RLZ25_1686 [Pseudomonadota bacterium]|jgi:uncharacterized protein (TIGR01777 family)